MPFIERRQMQREKELMEEELHAGFKAAVGQKLHDYESVSFAKVGSQYFLPTVKQTFG